MNQRCIPFARVWALAVVALGVAVTLPLRAQTDKEPGGQKEAALVMPSGTEDLASSSSAEGAGALPEAPSALGFLPQQEKTQQDQQMPGYVAPKDPTAHIPPVASLRSKYIPAGYAYKRLSAQDKIYIGLRDTYAPGDIGDWFLAAGWSHLVNGQPHYGTDRGAFGERLGAAAINETAEGIFDDSVFAVIFKEDPRYFVEGPSHDLLHRTVHAVSRVVITRNDNGSHGPNLALFASYAAVHSMDRAFYPRIDRDPDSFWSGMGGSLGGAALGYLVDEFMADALQAVHLKKKP